MYVCMYTCMWVHGTSSVRHCLQIYRVAAYILNKQSRILDKGWSSNLGLERGAKKLLTVKKLVTKYYTGSG